ncbi:MAG TPA: SMC-Scp complex subunit ScpB [Stellaceae bacterium]|nr:SMC-Scp complex subunit ScpB [Stellaceae bacterium]
MTETPTDPHADALRLIEALLFASASPVEEESIAERLPEDADVTALLAEIAEHYSGRGVNLVKIAGGWTFRTAPDIGPRLKLETTVQRRLSRAAVETLAIIAYHQPVTRAEIEEIRGVQISKGTIDTLLEAGWIMPKGRRETVGRPVTWGTSEAFLHHFGLGEIADLPGMDELKAAGLIGEPPVVSLRENSLPADATPANSSEPEEPSPELDALAEQGELVAGHDGED